MGCKTLPFSFQWPPGLQPLLFESWGVSVQSDPLHPAPLSSPVSPQGTAKHYPVAYPEREILQLCCALCRAAPCCPGEPGSWGHTCCLPVLALENTAVGQCPHCSCLLRLQALPVPSQVTYTYSPAEAILVFGCLKTLLEPFLVSAFTLLVEMKSPELLFSFVMYGLVSWSSWQVLFNFFVNSA